MNIINKDRFCKQQKLKWVGWLKTKLTEEQSCKHKGKTDFF